MYGRRFSVILSGLVLSVAVVARAGESHDQHHHHDSSDEVLGTVDFPTSCAPEVEATFERAMALLHSFGYDHAREGFLEVTGNDPKCAMAWWGVAMTYYHPIWAPPGPEEFAAAREAVEKARKLEPRTEREKAYIETIARFFDDPERLDHNTRAKAYRDALDELAKRFPDDDEAKIFHALSLLGTAPPGDTTYAQQRRAAEILTPLLEKHPQHPGIAHYVIHSFDYPQLAELALPAARGYARIAPASPHAQHMPSHIFVRLGLWKESIASNLDSEASANALVEKAHPGQDSWDALHALDYLVYGYLQIGDDEKAKEALERVNRARTLDQANFGAGYAIAAAPARYVLERRVWADAAALPMPEAKLPWERFPYALANLHFARAVGGARSGQPGVANKALAEIASIRETLAQSPPAGPYDWVGQVESLRLAAQGWIAHAEGRTDEGLALLRKAADLQDKVDKHPVTPGEVLPARELLADLLFEIDRPADALAEYEATLEANRGRLNALSGAARAAEAAGETKKAESFREKIAAQVVATPPRAEFSRLPEPS